MVLSPEYSAILVTLLSGIAATFVLVIGALGQHIIWRLKQIETAQGEAKERGTKIIETQAKLDEGQSAIKDIVSNGPANKIARRVLEAEDSYAAIKLNSIASDTIRDLNGEEGSDYANDGYTVSNDTDKEQTNTVGLH